MSDKEKLSLVDKIIGDAWEWNIMGSRENFFEGVLCAVESVVLFAKEE